MSVLDCPPIELFLSRNRCTFFLCWCAYAYVVVGIANRHFFRYLYYQYNSFESYGRRLHRQLLTSACFTSWISYTSYWWRVRALLSCYLYYRYNSFLPTGVGYIGILLSSAYFASWISYASFRRKVHSCSVFFKYTATHPTHPTR